MNIENRYDNEKKYWDKQITKILNDAFYNYKIDNLSCYEDLFKSISYLSPVVDFWGNIADKKILDIACGDGWISLSLAKSNAYVYGFDISSKRIEVAKRYAEVNSLDKRVNFQTMICEEMRYDDNFFDYAIMHAALHHCDIEKTSKQIHRVLKPGGKAVLIEDYAYNPLMNLYRRFTAHKHTKYEKALSDKELEVFVSPFSSHFYTYFGLFNIFETSHDKLLCKIKPFLRSLDNFLYTAAPHIKKYSKLIGIFVVK